MATIEPNFESICINPNDDLVLYKKELVRSRIEKFLYAICSLDNDDLPTPLSRIEEMYKCLVMGVDFITFTPLSRAEKFVMAMLGAYDVELLPTPISRSETLMKKIATGDNNLDDIDNLQSRYEFLLAYIIKAGGYNGGSEDFYYNLTSLTSGHTTIYDTSDMPVKNAVLRGQTLVNISSLTGVTTLKPGDVIFIENTGMKMNTTYTIMFNCSSVPSTNFVEIRTMMDNTQITQVQQNVTVGCNKFTIKTNASKETNRFRFKSDTTSTTDFIFSELVILEGDYTNENIPYFEGMASVKMPVLTTTGKNLFYGTLESGDFNTSTGIPNNTSKSIVRTKEYNEISPNKTYRITVFNTTATLSTYFVYEYDNNFNFIERTESNVFTTNVDTKYVKFRFRKSDNTLFTEEELAALSCMITEGDTIPDTYEPHKSNILTCNEEVELRGIGDIKDELNLMTGELTQRIGEIVLDGSEDWQIDSDTNDYRLALALGHNGEMLKYSQCICNRYPTKTGKQNDTTYNYVYIGSTSINLYENPTTTLEGFKSKLKQNPITFQYQLTTESIKTVDLSIVDQDGKKTKLNTFDDITHVTTSSEGLIPTGEIDIARPIQFVDYSLDNSLTTLYNTLEYPVKSAILKGQTLVNCLDMSLVTTSEKASKSSDGTITIDNNTNFSRFNVYNNQTLIPSSSDKQFILFFHNVVGDISALSMDVNGLNINITDNKYIIFKTRTVDISNRMFWVQKHRDKSATTDTVSFKVTILEYQEGMENWDIPYFDGMTSVKMPVLTTYGKNLFDVSRHGSLTPQPTGDIQLNSAEWGKYDIKYILKPNTQYTLTILGDGTKCWMAIFIDGSLQSSNVEKSYTKTFSTNSNGEVTIGIYANSDKYVGYSRNSISIEEGTVSTPYEPFKSNILTCNEEVELRSIGDIKDELNLMTGELTQRIGEIVLDGSEKWEIREFNTTNTECVIFTININDKLNNRIVICDKFKYTGTDIILANNIEGIYTGGKSYSFFINVSKTKASTVEEFKNWLSNNNITVQYQSIESVKTVDLSTLDQDGKETKLNTFDDITHVSVSSEGLVPTGEITVATKNATDVIDASVMSLRMDDILNSQRTLEGPANAQSDDIDVTMLGTTDIYEQLL